ncbi:MAG TPA: hypothetical protein VGQ25_07850 [Gemmatimonadales bacterium]|jgi:hypothetical protein|nr:hypothetical protein [Gemmatimonadales bacterium]
MNSRSPLALLAAALLAACDHGAPFVPRDYRPDGPFDPSSPTRLTLNLGKDRGPVWLPDGTAILYSVQRFDRADHDHCWAVLPPGGGTIRRYACRTTAEDDSLNVFEEAALAADGRLAYVRAGSGLLLGPPLAPGAQALVLATLANPNDARVLLNIGYLAPSGRVHQGVSHIRWLGPDRLVFVGENVTYPRPCSACSADTVRTGIEIATLDLAAQSPVLAVVSGTDGASSVAPGVTGDTIYFTRNGDSRVYRYAFSSGQTDTIYDFGGAGIARDLALTNGRLLAVVGGDISYTVDSVLGPTQVDNGGTLHLVTLGTGSDTVLGAALTLLRRPAVSPDGTRVAAELWTSRTADLWLVEVP